MSSNILRPKEIRALRIKDACVAYSLSRSSLYKLMKEGKLRAAKVGGRRLITVEALDALLAGASK